MRRDTSEEGTTSPEHTMICLLWPMYVKRLVDSSVFGGQSGVTKNLDAVLIIFCLTCLRVYMDLVRVRLLWSSFTTHCPHAKDFVVIGTLVIKPAVGITCLFVWQCLTQIKTQCIQCLLFVNGLILRLVSTDRVFTGQCDPQPGITTWYRSTLIL